MKTFMMHGPDLYDSHKHRIAVCRGMGIYNGDNQRVGTVRGDIFFDLDNRIMISIRGGEIFDALNNRIASLLDVKKSIAGAEEEMAYAALWYCFVR